MKMFNHVHVREGKPSMRLALPEKSVNFSLRNKFDPQGNTGFEQPSFDQSKYCHVGNAEFHGGFSHRVSVPLQRLIIFRFNHLKKNGNLRELSVEGGNPRMIDRCGENVNKSNLRSVVSSTLKIWIFRDEINPIATC
jgi:hypothetical protein